MVSDERFFSFMKYLLHRIADLEVELAAVQIVLKVNYSVDFAEKVQKVAAKLEESPESKDFREAIDTLELAEILDAFAKYKGTIQ